MPITNHKSQLPKTKFSICKVLDSGLCKERNGVANRDAIPLSFNIAYLNLCQPYIAIYPYRDENGGWERKIAKKNDCSLSFVYRKRGTSRPFLVTLPHI